jgi:glycosyltransferase involved in cell wall biosynthesis
MIKGIFIFLHRGSNYGFAIAPLETTFFKMALSLVEDERRIHFGYPDLSKGFPLSLPADFKNVIAFDATDGSEAAASKISRYIRSHDVDVAFGFDQPVQRPIYKTLRKAGAHTFVSYWGAPMSSLNRGLKFWLKKWEVALRRYRPDHFIFESYAMAETAVMGRGVPAACVSVVPLGIDTDRFKPPAAASFYAHDQFRIPRERRIIFYSGHMEERKGVHVLIQAASHLVNTLHRKDCHFLMVGNRDHEERRFDPLYRNTPADACITFGGYRGDMESILPSCFIGAIPSSGWDSFPRSSLEMNACGLPLVASKLQGITEQVDDGVTGFLSEPGDPQQMADRIMTLLDQPEIRDRMGAASRRLVVEKYSIHRQIESLSAVVKKVHSRTAR